MSEIWVLGKSASAQHEAPDPFDKQPSAAPTLWQRIQAWRRGGQQ